MGGLETAPSVLAPTPTACAVELEPVREDASGPAASVSIAFSLASAAGRLRAGGGSHNGYQCKMVCCLLAHEESC